MKSAPRQFSSVRQRQIGVGEVDCEYDIVFANCGTEQERTHAAKLEFESREMACFVVEDTLLAETNRLNVTASIEDGKRIAMQQDARAVVCKGRGCADVELLADFNDVFAERILQ